MSGTAVGMFSSADLKAELARRGYVALKADSYRRAQERQRIAHAERDWAIEDRESTRAWALTCCNEERRIRDRLTFVWGVAQAHGATVQELGGCINALADSSA